MCIRDRVAGVLQEEVFGVGMFVWLAGEEFVELCDHHFLVCGPAKLVADLAEQAGNAVSLELLVESELRCGDIALGGGGQRATLARLLNEGGAGLACEVRGGARE